MAESQHCLYLKDDDIRIPPNATNDPSHVPTARDRNLVHSRSCASFEVRSFRLPREKPRAPSTASLEHSLQSKGAVSYGCLVLCCVNDSLLT